MGGWRSILSWVKPSWRFALHSGDHPVRGIYPDRLRRGSPKEMVPGGDGPSRRRSGSLTLAVSS